MKNHNLVKSTEKRSIIKFKLKLHFKLNDSETKWYNYLMTQNTLAYLKCAILKRSIRYMVADWCLQIAVFRWSGNMFSSNKGWWIKTKASSWEQNTANNNNNKQTHSQSHSHSKILFRKSISVFKSWQWGLC